MITSMIISSVAFMIFGFGGGFLIGTIKENKRMRDVIHNVFGIINTSIYRSLPEDYDQETIEVVKDVLHDIEEILITQEENK